MSQQALTNIRLQNQISYLQTLCLNPNLPSGPIGPQGPQGNTGAAGPAGASAFTVLLSGGATFSPTTLSTFTTNGSNGYGVTAEAYNSGCLVSAYAERGTGGRAVFIGLSESATFTTSPISNSLNYGLYADGATIQVVISGQVQTHINFPNSNPNYTYTVKYDNQNITFLLDGVVLDPSWVIPVGAGKIYYGGWCSYNSITYSRLQWNQLVGGGGGSGNPFNVLLVANAGLDVTAGTTTLAGGATVDNSLSVSGGVGVTDGGLTVTAGGLRVTAGTTSLEGGAIVNNGLSVTNGGIEITDSSEDSFTMSIVNNIGQLSFSQNSSDSDAAFVFNGPQISSLIWDAGDQTRKTSWVVGPESMTVNGVLQVNGNVGCSNVALPAGGQVTVGGVPIGGTNTGIIQSFVGSCTTNQLPGLGSYSMFEIPYNNPSITTYSFVITNLSFAVNNYGGAEPTYYVDFWISNLKDTNRNFNSSYYTAVVVNPPVATPVFQSTNAIFLQWQSLNSTDVGTNLYFNYRVSPDNGGSYKLSSVVINAEVTGLTQTVSSVTPIYF